MTKRDSFFSNVNENRSRSFKIGTSFGISCLVLLDWVKLPLSLIYLKYLSLLGFENEEVRFL